MGLILILSLSLSAAIVLFVYIILSDNVQSSTFFMSQSSNVSPITKKTMNFMGGDILALFPEKYKKYIRTNHNLDRLFIESANPWHISKLEFTLLRYLLGIGGLALSLLVTILFLLFNMFTFSIPFIILGFTFFGSYYPKMYYKSVADDRILAFKKELPGAIDYLALAMDSGAFNLAGALEEITGYIKPGVMRDEFFHLISDLKTGRGMETTLNDFSKRAPTEGIAAFVNALNNANKLSVPLGNILRARAEASRKEANAEIDKRIKTLPTKVMLVLTPVTYVCILIVALAPAITSMGSLGL